MDREQKQSATQSGIEPVPDESLWELLEQLPDAVLLVGANGAIQHVNPQAARMFGYEPAELVGQSIESLLPERLRARHVQHRHAYAQAARLRPMGAGLELAGRHKSGAEFPVEIMLNPLAGPRAGSTFAVVRDISARKQVERDIQALNQQLRKELRAMQRLHAVSTQRLDEGGLEPLLREILATAVDVSDADFGIMQLPDRRSGALKIAVQRGFAEAVCEFFDSVHARKAAGTTAMDPSKRIIVENIDDSGSLFDQDSLRLLRAAALQRVQEGCARNGLL